MRICSELTHEATQHNGQDWGAGTEGGVDQVGPGASWGVEDVWGVPHLGLMGSLVLPITSWPCWWLLYHVAHQGALQCLGGLTRGRTSGPVTCSSFCAVLGSRPFSLLTLGPNA